MMFLARKIFTWHGTDPLGNLVQGQTKGRRKKDIFTALLAKNIQPLEIRCKRRCVTLPWEQLPIIFKKFSTLLSMQVPITQAFELVKNHTERKVYQALNEMLQDMHQGISFSTCISSYLSDKDKFLAKIIHIGEESGCLDEILDKLAEQQEKKVQLAKKIKRAVLYPTCVILSALLTLAFLVHVIIPQFESFYANFNAQLPFYTRITINFSHYLERFWGYLGLFGAFVICGGHILYRVNYRFRFFIAKLVWHSPVVGNLHRLFTHYSSAYLLYHGLPRRGSPKQIFGMAEQNIWQSGVPKYPGILCQATTKRDIFLSSH